MAVKIIPFPVPKHSPPASPLSDPEIDFSCSVIALEFTEGKSVADLAAEWALEESIITDILRAQIDRTYPAQDRLRYQLAVAEC
jgi:hypothetical protein